MQSTYLYGYEYFYRRKFLQCFSRLISSVTFFLRSIIQNYVKFVCLQSSPSQQLLYFSFLTKRILKDPIKVCLLSEPWSKPKTVSQHSELICRTVVPSHVISKKRRDRIGHKYLPRIEPALIYCFLRANIRNNLCTVFSVIHSSRLDFV